MIKKSLKNHKCKVGFLLYDVIIIKTEIPN